MNNPLYRRVATAFTVLLASTASMATSIEEPFEFDCSNQIDDDDDGQIDLADSDCIPPPFDSCGNGFLQPLEACDDGNTTSGDGCRADCRGVEVCGDGFIDPANGELCDDGNIADGDACSFDCTAISATSFESARDINGLGLGEVNTAVFGESVVTRPFGSSRLLVVVASNDPLLCDNIDAATSIDAEGSAITGFEAFFSELISGKIAAPVALITAEKLGDISPFAAPAALQSSDAVLVDGGFLVGDGAAPLVDTLFSGGLDGSLVLQSISTTDIAGQYDGTQDFEFVTDTALNVGLRGIFVGTHCQSLSDGLQPVFGQ